MTSTDKLAAARAGKRQAATKREQAVTARVKEILASSRVDPELKRKLQFCQEVAEGKHPGSSHDLMLQRRTELIREASHRFPAISP